MHRENLPDYIGGFLDGAFGLVSSLVFGWLKVILSLDKKIIL